MGTRFFYKRHITSGLSCIIIGRDYITKKDCARLFLSPLNCILAPKLIPFILPRNLGLSGKVEYGILQEDDATEILNVAEAKVSYKKMQRLIYMPATAPSNQCPELDIDVQIIVANEATFMKPKTTQRRTSLSVPQEQKEFSVVSLFSGCGGMDLGCIGGFSVFGNEYCKNPFNIEWANELNPDACKSYARNIGSNIHCGDIRDYIDKLPSQTDVLIGCFPCQDISINGKGLGVNGKRSSLYTYMVEAIKLVKPKVFIAENVKGLLMKTRKESLDKILHDFN